MNTRIEVVESSASYKMKLPERKLFTVYFKKPAGIKDEPQKIYWTDTFGSAEKLAEQEYPHLEVDRVGVMA